jgi:SAM-dependent methyltransferase
MRNIPLLLAKRFSRRRIYPFLKEECRKIQNPVSVLNIGAGGEVEALIKAHLATDDYQFQSLDVDADRQPSIVHDICSYRDELEGRFDVIFMVEVLEHLHSPKEALCNVARYLKPGGSLILTTPFLFPLHDEPYDYFRYTYHGLMLCLGAHFEEVEVLPRNRLLETVFILLLRSQKQGKFIPWAFLPAACVYYLLTNSKSLPPGTNGNSSGNLSVSHNPKR